MTKQGRENIYTVKLLVEIPTPSHSEKGAMKSAEDYLSQQMQRLHSESKVEAFSASRYLRHDEVYDKESFDKEIEDAIEQDDIGYDNYINEMSGSHNLIISREEYKKAEAEVLKKYYRQVLDRMKPEDVVFEIARQDKEMNKLFDSFPAQQIANDILVKRSGNPSDNQLKSLVNVYINYLIEVNKKPLKMEEV